MSLASLRLSLRRFTGRLVGTTIASNRTLCVGWTVDSSSLLCDVLYSGTQFGVTLYSMLRPIYQGRITVSGARNSSPRGGVVSPHVSAPSCCPPCARGGRPPAPLSPVPTWPTLPLAKPNLAGMLQDDSHRGYETPLLTGPPRPAAPTCTALMKTITITVFTCT